MKKQTLDENPMKISELADSCIADPSVAGMLLCYLLYHVGQPVEAEALYDICVTGGIISYFTYRESIDTLLKSNDIQAEKLKNREVLYSVTERGIERSGKLCDITDEADRDALVESVKRTIQSQLNQKDAVITYEPLERGCHLHVILKDRDLTLLDFRLFTPDVDTARQLGDRIRRNPSLLYHDVLQAVISEHETAAD